jgi:hypothetical protein
MKTEVTILPNTSRATMPPAAHPANDAGPRIAPASVWLRRLHARTWTGVWAELLEMHATERSLVELPCDTMLLNEVCGRPELVVVFNNDALGASKGGKSIIAARSTAAKGRVSRIVPRRAYRSREATTSGLSEHRGRLFSASKCSRRRSRKGAVSELPQLSRPRETLEQIPQLSRGAEWQRV